MRSNHSARKKFVIPFVNGSTLEFTMASDNLYVPTEEAAQAYASRKVCHCNYWGGIAHTKRSCDKGIKTEKEREVEKATKGEEEYVPNKLELSSAILEEKVEEDSEESAHAKKKRGPTPYFFCRFFWFVG